VVAEQYYKSKHAQFDDPVVIPMLELCWGLYDDTKEHKLIRADQLSKESLKLIARCILFLHSDKEYEWPYFDTNNPLFKFSLKDFIITILTIGHHYRNRRFELEQSFKDFQKLGDYDYWPFLRKGDYTEQLNKQPFLDARASFYI
jgi:hypothetical protein